MQTTSKNDYMHGIKDGGYERDKANTKAFSRLQQLKNLENSRDRNLDQE